MAQAFNHFVKFLMEHEPKPVPLPASVAGAGCIGFLLAFAIIPLSLLIGVGIFLTSFLMIAWTQTRNKKRASDAQLTVPAELKDTWDFLRWIGFRRELNRRTHPALRDLLEEIAEIRRTTLDALGSEVWKLRGKNPEGAQAVRDIEAVLKEALYDSIFIGRHLFRGKGQRETTFGKRCADPEFGRHALESIGQIRDEMRGLCESALEAGAQSDLRVVLVKERLRGVMDAEREVEDFSSFDAT